MTNGDPQASAFPRRRRVWRRRLLILAGLCAAIWLGRFWLLKQMAEWLIVSSPIASAHGVASLAGIAGLEESQRLLQSGVVRRLILAEETPSRVESLGILPSQLNQSLAQVQRLGIAADSIDMIPRIVTSTDDFLTALGEYAATRPSREVLLLVDEWHSGEIHYKVSKLPGEQQRMIHVVAVDYPELDSSNWWQSRRGVRTVLSAGTQRIAAIVCHRSNAHYVVRDETDFRSAAVVDNRNRGER